MPLKRLSMLRSSRYPNDLLAHLISTSAAFPRILWQMQHINITYDRKVPEKYLGLEGWPPGKDRHMPNYIKPDQDTFPLRPSKAHFKGCEILVIIHSAIDGFSMRMGVRDTWMQFVTQKKVDNVSVIFLIGNENPFNNLTVATR